MPTHFSPMFRFSRQPTPSNGINFLEAMGEILVYRLHFNWIEFDSMESQIFPGNSRFFIFPGST